jgi:hypothetical protein
VRIPVAGYPYKISKPSPPKSYRWRGWRLWYFWVGREWQEGFDCGCGDCPTGSVWAYYGWVDTPIGMKRVKQ